MDLLRHKMNYTDDDNCNNILQKCSKLKEIKYKFRCFNVLKYFLIHSYPSELSFLYATFDILKSKYPECLTFISSIEIIFTSIGVDRSQKINSLVEIITMNNYYELYEDLYKTLRE